MEPLIFANFHESPFIKHDERHGMRYRHGLGLPTEPIEEPSSPGPFSQFWEKGGKNLAGQLNSGTGVMGGP